MTTPSRPRKKPEEQRPPVVIRDKRRIDPDTLQLRPGSEERLAKPSGQQGAGGPASALLGGGAAPSPGQAPAGAGGESLRAALAERTQDLQRVKAEYDNFRRLAALRNLAEHAALPVRTRRPQPVGGRQCLRRALPHVRLGRGRNTGSRPLAGRAGAGGQCLGSGGRSASGGSVGY
ncbi:hypothetical protein ACWCXH_34825 [Kitasatospora sp. NPDC001660]